MKSKFAVTFEIVTEESAEHGDAEERGYIDQELGLRDAVAATQMTRTCHVGGIESIEPDSGIYPGARVRWITIANQMEFLTGEYESRSLHIPESVTAASSRRIARLLGVRSARFLGVRK